MDIQERAELAANLKKSGECNCTQAVLKVFKDEIPVDEKTLLAMARGFAGGMGCLESTCGALIGAVIALGVIGGDEANPRMAAKIHRAFVEKCGDSICKNLKGVGTGKVLCDCGDCVKNAVISLCEVTNI
ncbi:C-GCAxxG-C-C family protein [Treponema pectinovorum]|uniref:C-GCAxxG-C-C family protein n=1 Tax=Treponema pectinovorum TaxID=164 RepID=UPI0011F1CF25|nr:C-GCAxxG-C-C family protein [Treponema pectinovorum]